ncbi:MAG: hypothetical protein ACYC46_15775 [Acidobacteriaceae bacterium]
MGVKAVTLRFFYDIPVYRLPEERYYRERDDHIDSIVFPKNSPFSDSMRAKEAADPNHYAAIRDHLQRSYGGCWIFNEIIGYIRLHFLGSQIRGEYFGVKKKRIVRTRTKTIEYLSWKLAPEINIPHPYTNKGIYGAILEYLAACRKELPGRYVDTERFEVIGKHVDWRGLLESNDAQPGSQQDAAR